jgi:succinyl-CoA synthetase beta subunit
VASKNGGVEIEEVAKTDPDSIIVEPIDVNTGLTTAIMDRVIDILELQSERAQARVELENLYKMFMALDATQVEINPWATDPHNKLFCIDAKINIDDNAKFR